MLSDDESTLYCAGKQVYGQSRSNTNKSQYAQYTFYAYNTTDGSVKFRLKTGGNHAYSPALGSGNMIYVAGGTNPSGSITSGTWNYPGWGNPTGMVVAIHDIGQESDTDLANSLTTNDAESKYIKWELILPDDGVADTNCCATVTVNGKNVIYVASGSGRIYCIEDEGDCGKILWEYFAPELCARNMSGWWNNTTFTPPNLAVNDDGSVVAVLGDTLLKFPAGFNSSSPEGISGKVTDASGNPIAGAWVSVSPTAYDQPLADNPNRLWTQTNADGTYQISPRFTSDTVFPVSYNVASSAVGYGGSANQTIAFTDKNSKLSGVNFILTKAKYNWALATDISASTNIHTSYPPARAVDGVLTGNYKSAVAKASTLPCSYVINLGTPRTISEAVIYWWWIAGAQFSIDYSNDGVNWSDPVYTASVTDNRGFPVDFYGGDPSAVPTLASPTYGVTSGVVVGGQKTAIDVIKIPSNTPAAQYWRVTITSGRFGVVGAYTTKTTGSNTPAVWEIELRDSSLAAVDPTVGGAKASPDKSGVRINSAVVTAADGGVPSGSIFVESEDRTAGIRVNASNASGFIFGDRVSVLGKINTDTNGEKYIDATSVTKLSAGVPLDALGMNNKAAAETTAQGLFAKIWGKVSAVDADNFTISDGSSTAVKVLCGDVTKPSVGDNVRVRGVTGKDASGPVLYMRGDRCDWTTADAAFQALPFSGTYKYPSEYLVLGPFSNSTIPDYWSDWLYGVEYPDPFDFISVATGGAATETGISQPKAGDILAGKTWTKGYATNGKLDINSVFGGTTAGAVAYVYLNIWSEVDNPAVELATGSDDWLRVYVNGQSFRIVDVLSSDSEYTSDGSNVRNSRACNYGDDYSATETIPLHKGSNDILFKVVNNVDSFALTSQFVPAGYATGTYGYGGYPAYTATGLGYLK